MPYIGGTPEVQKFIKKYKANGHLIDPYSKEWLSSLDTRRNADQDFYCEIDHDQYSEYEAEFGAEFWNHLLILRIDQSNPELIKDLKAIYQPFKFILEDRNSLSGYENHRPNFILINLHIRKILCIGLGRKNRLFGFDLNEYCNNLPNSVNFSPFIAAPNFDDTYKKDFLSLDHAGLVVSLVQGLSELGAGLFEIASTPGNPDEWPDEPNEDGMYLTEDGEFTAEEFEAIKDGYYQADELMHDGITSINLLFPEIEIGDLNTGDY
jgi:hypothetical protein